MAAGLTGLTGVRVRHAHIPSRLAPELVQILHLLLVAAHAMMPREWINFVRPAVTVMVSSVQFLLDIILLHDQSN